MNDHINKSDLSPIAIRALEEAEERRSKAAAQKTLKPKEKGGPKGAEPTRFGDWERNGRAIDF